MSTLVGLDPVFRLQVMAAALPGSTVVSREIGAPFESVWTVVADQERFSPLYEPGVAEVVGEERAGRRILRVTYANGHREECAVRMARGWCLMQSASVVVAFAARPSESGTLLAHLEHWRVPGRTPFKSSKKLEGELLKIESLARRLRWMRAST